MSNKRVNCEYCSTLNPAGQNQCIACGAPLPVPSIGPVRITEVNSPASTIAEPISQIPQSMSQQMKDGVAVAAAGLGALGIGTLLLRLAAEAAAIACAALIIGLNAGSASISFKSAPLYLFLAAAGGGLTGLCVGLVTKRVFWSLVSAPAGALIGSIPVIFFHPNTLSQFTWSVFLSTIGAMLFALLGGRRGSKVPLHCLQRVRPILGLIGGLLFGMLGFFISHRIY